MIPQAEVRAKETESISATTGSSKATSELWTSSNIVVCLVLGLRLNENE